MIPHNRFRIKWNITVRGLCVLWTERTQWLACFHFNFHHPSFLSFPPQPPTVNLPFFFFPFLKQESLFTTHPPSSNIWIYPFLRTRSFLIPTHFISNCGYPQTDYFFDPVVQSESSGLLVRRSHQRMWPAEQTQMDPII